MGDQMAHIDSGATPVHGALTFPRWASQLSVLFMMAAAFTATWTGFQGAGVQIADLFLVMALFSCAVQVAFGALRFEIPWWLWPPVIGVLLCATATSFSPIPNSFVQLRYQGPIIVPGTVVKSAFWIIALFAVPLVVIACTVLESRATKWIMASYVAGVSTNALVALTDLTGLTQIAFTLGYRSNNIRQTGLSDHPNTLGVVCVIAAPIAVFFLSSAQRRWIPAIALVLLAGGELASGSRGGQALFPLIVFVSILCSPQRKKIFGWLAALFATAILGGILFLSRYIEDFSNQLFRFGAQSSAGSDSERTILFNQGLNDFQHYPLFGIGVKHINEAHNIVLQLLSVGGIVLTATMLAYWFGMLRTSWLGARAGEPMAPFLGMSVVAWLAGGLFENQLTDRHLYYTVGCLAALAVSMRHPANEQPGSADLGVEARSGAGAHRSSTGSGRKLP